MEAKAIAKIIRGSSQKANEVAELIKYKKISEAFAILENSPRKAAGQFLKVLNSAVANATENHGMTADDLIVLKAVANEGPTIKRYRARAKGRADKISKRTSHLEIIVTDDFKGKIKK